MDDARHEQSVIRHLEADQSPVDILACRRYRYISSRIVQSIGQALRIDKNGAIDLRCKILEQQVLIPDTRCSSLDLLRLRDGVQHEHGHIRATAAAHLGGEHGQGDRPRAGMREARSLPVGHRHRWHRRAAVRPAITSTIRSSTIEPVGHGRNDTAVCPQPQLVQVTVDKLDDGGRHVIAAAIHAHHASVRSASDVLYGMEEADNHSTVA